MLARALEVRRSRQENLQLRNTVAIHELTQAIAHTLDPAVLLDEIADAIVSLDAERRIILFNSAAERTFGWMAAEVLGKSLELLIPERPVETHRRHIEAFDRAPITTIPMQERKPLLARRKDGTEFPAAIGISRLEDNGSRIYTAVLRDVTPSLAYLARLPVSVIKIDPAFVRNVNDDADSATVVQTIISLTHALNRKVIAEGVETEEQARLLRLLRCDQYQGFLFSKPVPLDELEPMLSASRAP